MDAAQLAIVAAALLAYGSVSKRAERSPVTPPLFFVAVGLALSPLGVRLRHAGQGSRA